jgi:hypothetical protein
MHPHLLTCHTNPEKNDSNKITIVIIIHFKNQNDDISVMVYLFHPIGSKMVRNRYIFCFNSVCQRNCHQTNCPPDLLEYNSR